MYGRFFLLKSPNTLTMQIRLEQGRLCKIVKLIVLDAVAEPPTARRLARQMADQPTDMMRSQRQAAEVFFAAKEELS
jgi:hypothetical protein